MRGKEAQRFLEYLKSQRDDAVNKLVYSNKRTIVHRFSDSTGQVQSTADVEDISELLRGKIMVLDDILAMPIVIQRTADAEIKARAEQNKKESEENG